MELDVYQQCPCHTDKKIKFCCGKDVVGDLNRVLELHRSNQTQAALDTLERAIQKHGEQDCLLTTKVQLLGSLRLYDEAMATNEKFLSKNPQHYLGLEQRANLEAIRGNVLAAFTALQDAMDHLPSAEIPVSFATAFRLVAMALLSSGHNLAARAHAHIALQLRDHKDDMAAQIVGRSFGSSTMVPALYQEITIPLLPEGEFPWRKRYENVLRATRRGQFRKGFEIATRALEAAPDDLWLVRLVALASVNVADPENSRLAWRRYARHPQLGMMEQIYAEMMFQSMSFAEAPAYQFTSEFQLENLEGVVESLLADPRARALSGNVLSNFSRNGIQPRNVFILGSGPIVAYDETKPLSELTYSEGLIVLFGRQTDSPPRVSLIMNQEPETHPIFEQLKAIDPTLTLVPGNSGRNPLDKLLWSVDLPYDFEPNPTHPQMFSLGKRHKTEFFTGAFLDRTWAGLEGATIRECMADPQSIARGHALIMRALMAIDSRELLVEIANKLSGIFNTQIPPNLEDSEIPDVLHVPFLINFINLEALSDERLHQCLMATMNTNSHYMIGRVLDEMKRRDYSSEVLPRWAIFQMLGEIAEDNQVALDHFAQSRSLARAAGESIGLILVSELRQRLIRGITSGTQRLMSELTSRFQDDEETQTALHRVLYELGMLTPDGRMVAPEEAVEDASPTGIWVPGNSLDSEGSEVGEPEPSKLWLPGQ